MNAKNIQKTLAIALIWQVASMAASAQSQQNFDTINNFPLAGTSALTWIDGGKRLLYCADEVLNSYGTISLSSGNVSCCAKPEQKLKSDDVTTTYIGKISIADSLVALRMQFDQKTKELTIYAHSFFLQQSKLKLIAKIQLQEKPFLVLATQNERQKDFVVSVLSKTMLHTVWVAENLENRASDWSVLAFNPTKFTTFESHLGENGTLYFGMGKKLGRKNSQLHLISKVLTSKKIHHTDLSEHHFISPNFKITSNSDGSKVVLAGTMPTITLPDLFINTTFGLFCLEFSRNLKLDTRRDYRLFESDLNNYHTLLGQRPPKTVFEGSGSTSPTIGNFKVQSLKILSNGDIIAVFEDLHVNNNGCTGNIAVLNFSTNGTESVNVIPKISEMPSVFLWHGENLYIDFVLDTKKHIARYDKANRIKHYASFENKYPIEYALVREVWAQNQVKNAMLLPLEEIKPQVLGFAVNIDASTAYLLTSAGLMSGGNLFIIKQ